MVSPQSVSGRRGSAKCHILLSIGLTASGPASSTIGGETDSWSDDSVGTLVPMRGSPIENHPIGREAGNRRTRDPQRRPKALALPRRAADSEDNTSYQQGEREGAQYAGTGRHRAAYR